MTAAREGWPAAGPPGREDSERRGRAARSRVPRASHGGWSASARRSDPVRVLAEQEVGRVAELLPVRHERMSASAFAFFRGAAAVMAADLAGTPVSGLEVQLCGDAHLSNFGGYASAERTLVFDLNDFDETVRGPWEWDLKRLVASVEVAGRDRGFSRAWRRETARTTAEAYRRAMRDFADLSTLQVWHARITADDVRRRWGSELGPRGARDLDRAVRKATRKDSARAAARLVTTVDGASHFLSDPPFLVPLAELADGDRRTSQRLVSEAMDGYHDSLPTERRHLLRQFSFVDAARRVSGVGSVGTRTWVVLLVDATGAPLVLQLKEAGPSALAPYLEAPAARQSSDRPSPADGADRVVAGQRLLQGSSDPFLGATRVTGVDGVARDFYVRQLWDWKVSPDLTRQDATTLAVYARMCAWTLARGHARSGDRFAIAGYLGRGDRFDAAMAAFAADYADQNEHDFERFVGSLAASHGTLIPRG
jgi:uncharacterized protein (DUF2252 family)